MAVAPLAVLPSPKSQLKVTPTPLALLAPNWMGAPGAAGPEGPQGEPGEAAAEGDDGWSPVFALVNDGARRVLDGNGGVHFDVTERETARVTRSKRAGRRPHAQTFRAKDGMILALARSRAESRRQLLAIDTAVPFERVLQVEEEERPTGIEPGQG